MSAARPRKSVGSTTDQDLATVVVLSILAVLLVAVSLVAVSLVAVALAPAAALALPAILLAVAAVVRAVRSGRRDEPDTPTKDRRRLAGPA